MINFEGKPPPQKHPQFWGKDPWSLESESSGFTFKWPSTFNNDTRLANALPSVSFNCHQSVSMAITFNHIFNHIEIELHQRINLPQSLGRHPPAPWARSVAPPRSRRRIAGGGALLCARSGSHQQGHLHVPRHKLGNLWR